jgi:hypothetical protein
MPFSITASYSIKITMRGVYVLLVVERRKLSGYNYHYHLKNEYYYNFVSIETVSGISKENNDPN